MIGFEAVAVDDDGFRTDGELVEGTMHRKDRGVEDVDLVDFFWRNDAYRPRHSIAFNLLAQQIPFLLGQLLGVVEHLVLIVFRQDNSSRKDAACQTTASSLIATGFDFVLVIMTR